MFQPQEGEALRPEDCHASGAMTNNGDCPPRRMGSVKRTPPDQLRGCAENQTLRGVRRRLGLTEQPSRRHRPCRTS
jgi:hypothetical protein